MEWIMEPQAWLALAALTALEIVLGIDNVIFISILVGRLPVEKRSRGRTLGLLLAMLMRIALLLCITWIMGVTKPLFSIFSNEISIRDLILMCGGLFLIAKSTHEIHANLEGEEKRTESAAISGFGAVLVQIAIMDIVFSFDSVITAVGMAKHVEVMILAIVIAIFVMIFAARGIGALVESHPTIKMLALSFLILVGVALFGEGLELHIPKGYIYFAMAFSVGVEILNINMRLKRSEPVKLHRTLK